MGPTGSAKDPVYGGPPSPPVVLKKNVHPAVVIVAGLAALFVLCFGGVGVLAAVAPAQLDAARATTTPPQRAAAPAQPAPAPLPATPAATSAPVVPTTTPAPPLTTTTAIKAPNPPVTTTTTHAVDLCGAPANPYGYNFCGGAYLYSPKSDICSYLSCIPNFWNGNGYVIQCKDGMFGKSGGIRGSCSYHQGNSRPLYD
jgi:hypothetical protein